MKLRWPMAMSVNVKVAIFHIQKVTRPLSAVLPVSLIKPLLTTSICRSMSETRLLLTCRAWVALWACMSPRVTRIMKITKNLKSLRFLSRVPIKRRDLLLLVVYQWVACLERLSGLIRITTLNQVWLSRRQRSKIWKLRKAYSKRLYLKLLILAAL